MSVLFVTSKDPFIFEGGDTAVTKALISVACEIDEVRVLALSDNKGAPIHKTQVTRVPKGHPALARLAASSVRTGRSLTHTRFSPPALGTALRELGPSVSTIIAEHTYMSESSIREGFSDKTFINTHVLEGPVMRARSDIPEPLLAFEARRIWRDELRCLASVKGVATLDQADTTLLHENGIASKTLDITFRPLARHAPSVTPNALFVGDRNWPPNLEAAARSERLFAFVQDKIPGSTLTIVGRGPHMLPANPGVRRLGFVASIDDEWAKSRVLFAPIVVGGGVRVKILDAASRGIPVLTTPAGAGSLADILPLVVRSTDEELQDELLAMLSDRGRAERASADLWDANEQIWRNRRLRAQVADWLNV